ncbi:MAG: DUF192 domain-containing protein [Acidobacteria bacterium]|nr:DUF192 domain-containing protein [Acidobacteriota bacterium]
MRILPSLAGLVLILAALDGCGGQKNDELGTSPVTFPDGTTIRAEVMRNPLDMARGMMFRERMEAGRGMLFVHNTPGAQRYWMYQVKIPLDLVFLDSDRRVVDIAANTPPCPPEKKANQCPSYGKADHVRYVLELAGGDAQKHNLKIGDELTF